MFIPCHIDLSTTAVPHFCVFGAFSGFSVIRDVEICNQLIDLVDRQARTLIHLAAASGKIHVLPGPGYRDVLASRAWKRDNNGLLSIHYMARIGSIPDSETMAGFGPLYLKAVTNEGWMNSVLDVALLSGALNLSMWLLPGREGFKLPPSVSRSSDGARIF
jgi:hypothetical protein